MNQLRTIDDIMEAWEEAIERGDHPSAEELCRDSPELLSEVKRQIQALQTFASRFGLLLEVDERGTDDTKPHRLPVQSIRISTVYQLERLYAAGGLGNIYLAHDAELNRRVALKFPRGSNHSAATRARFEREARITSRLDHPGIVPVHTIQSDTDGQLCYAMRFIEGQTLQEAILLFHQNPSPAKFQSSEFRDLLRRFQVVCDIVAYSHSQGVVHRDIKPSNIMLGKFGETLLVDWGLAKVLGLTEEIIPLEASAPATDNPVTTQAGQAIGTAAFASPEQLLGKHEEVDKPSDVFSLGATLFSLLTGEHLLTSVTLPEHLQLIKQGQLSHCRSRLPAVPVALDMICGKAIQVNAADRYASPQDLSRDIERYLADEPISIPCESWRIRSGRWLRKHTVLAAAAMAAICVGLVAAISSSVLLQDKNQELSKAITELGTTNQSLRQAYNDLGNTLVSRNVYRDKYAGALANSAQSLKALSALSSEVTMSIPARSQILTDSERAFFAHLRNRYQAFGEHSGATTESLYVRSIGRLRAGEISLALGDLDFSEAKLSDAKRGLLLLQAVSLVDVFDECLAQCCMLQGECQLAKGQRDLAISHLDEALNRFDKFLALPHARSPLDAQLHRASVLSRLCELHLGSSDSDALWQQLEASRRQLAELFLSTDQKRDVGIVLVETLRVEAEKRQRANQTPEERTLWEQAREVTGQVLANDPRLMRVRQQRAEVLLQLIRLIPEQSEQLITESIQILSLLVMECPTHAPFQRLLGRALETRHQLHQTSGDIASAAADQEFATSLLEPGAILSEIRQSQRAKLMADLAQSKQLILEGNHPRAEALLDRLIPQIRAAIQPSQENEPFVVLLIDALQLSFDIKSQQNQTADAEVFIAEAIAAIDSHSPNRRARLLLCQWRTTLAHRQAEWLVKRQRQSEAEQVLASCRSNLDQLQLDITEDQVLSIARFALPKVPVHSTAAESELSENTTAVRAQVESQRHSLNESLEVMRKLYVQADLLSDATTIWEREQRLTHDAWKTGFHNVTFAEPELGLSPTHWVFDEPEITYVEIQGHINGSVWGSGPYSDDSDLATAAVHAGVLKPGEIKFVGIRRSQKRQRHNGSTAHSVTTKDFPAETLCYDIVGAGLREPLFYSESLSPSITSYTVLVRGDSRGFAYGTDVYSVDSELSAAAVHMGLLKHDELSFIDVEMLPGQDRYAGSSRNGLTTRDNGPWHTSYRLSRPLKYRDVSASSSQ